MRKIRHLILLALIAVAALFTGRAEAASQILGLMSSNGMPTPLHCRDGVCSGFFASFCLQEARSAPTGGQEYSLAPGSSLTLIATLADGRRARVPAGDLATIRVRDGYLSVQISLPAASLAARGIPRDGVTQLALEVGPEAAILPVAMAGDPDPQTPEEVAEAIGPLRLLADRSFDRSGEDAGAARVIGLMINTLPPEEDSGTVALDDLLRQAVSGVGSSGQEIPGLAKAGRLSQNCQSFPATSLAIGFCLSGQQRGLLGTLNEEYWDDAGGS